MQKLPLETMQEIRRMKARIRQRNKKIRTLKEQLKHGVVLVQNKKPPQMVAAPVGNIVVQGIAKAIARELVEELKKAA